MVSHTDLEYLREATLDDVGGIVQLIEPLEADGTLVHASAGCWSATSPTSP